jgi:hypothetical protein
VSVSRNIGEEKEEHSSSFKFGANTKMTIPRFRKAETLESVDFVNNNSDQ